MALTDYIIMPGADYQAACDKLREKSGKTDPIRSGDLASEIEDVAGEQLPSAEAARFGGVEVEEKYSVQGDTLTGIAEQVQRLFDTDEAMSPEQMKFNLMNVVSASELPSAEEAAFGVAGDASTGILYTGNVSQATNQSLLSGGWKFTAGEAFSIIGIRHKQNNTAYKRLYLWDSAGNEIEKIDVSGDRATDWIEHYFDNPIAVAIGDTYTVSVSTYRGSITPKSEATFNSRLRDIQILSSSGEKCPTGTGYNVYLVDIIIAPVQAELPSYYQITRTTLDNIAIEAQRITGTTGKMTTTQIQSGLESVVLQEKTITPTTAKQDVVPDDGYYGLSKVTVEAAEVGGGSTFVSSAVGILPTVYKGAANMEFTLNLESSAIGALSEEK